MNGIGALGPQNPQNIPSENKPTVKSESNKATKAVSTGPQLQVSNEGKTLQQSYAAYQQKLANIQSQLQNGTYLVNMKTLAKAMLP